MSVEILSGLERKINFTIHKDAVQVIVKEKLKKHAKTAKMQGFRPGKVPANVVEQIKDPMTQMVYFVPYDLMPINCGCKFTTPKKNR